MPEEMVKEMKDKEEQDKLNQIRNDEKLAKLLEEKEEKSRNSIYFYKDKDQYDEEKQSDSDTDSEIVETNTVNSDDDEETVQKKLRLQELDRQLQLEKIDRDLALKLQYEEDSKHQAELDEKERAAKKRKG